MEQIKNSQSRKSVISFFNGVSMHLTSGNVVKTSLLLLFLISSIICLVKPGAQTGLVAILSIAAFGLIELISAYKRPHYKDHTADLETITKKCSELERQFKEIKDEASIANIGAAFGGTRRK